MFYSLFARCVGLLNAVHNAPRRRNRGRQAIAAQPATVKMAQVQPLESRAMLSATIVVTSLQDTTVTGKTTLRDAITQANTDFSGGDTITFDPTLTSGGPATITLTQGELHPHAGRTADQAIGHNHRPRRESVDDRRQPSVTDLQHR